MRLDRLDSYLKSFTARVLERRPATVGAAAGGSVGGSVGGSTDDSAGASSRAWLRLDRSAFYPTSGGQLHDTGVLAGVEVLDVKAEDGAVWHLLAAAATDIDVGDEVAGAIDWPRRFTHMQRHTGQHLLSQAFIRVGRARGADYATRSVSLRGPDCTLDLAGEPDDDALAAVEAEADAAARRAMPVTAFEVHDTDLGAYELRRPAKVSGLVRLVAIHGYDLVACGGTHVRSSAELLPIKLLSKERVKGGLTRVTFRVGAEALADYATKHDVASSLGAALSVPVTELPGRVSDLQAQLGEARREQAAARRVAAEGLAHDLLQAADRDSVPGVALVTHVLGAEQSGHFEALIDALQQAPASVALLAAVAADATVRLAFLAGPGTDVDVRPALSAALEVVSGRGGGRPDRAQGAGENGAKAEEGLQAAKRRLVAPR